MRDGRPERPFGSALGIGVDPLRIVGRLRERVDPRLRNLDPRGRPELDAEEIPRAASCRRVRARAQPLERRVLAEELEALVQAG